MLVLRNPINNWINNFAFVNEQSGYISHTNDGCVSFPAGGTGDQWVRELVPPSSLTPALSRPSHHNVRASTARLALLAVAGKQPLERQMCAGVKSAREHPVVRG